MHTHFLTLIHPQGLSDTDDSIQHALDIIAYNGATHAYTVRLSDTAMDILFTYTGAGFSVSDLRPIVDCGIGLIAHRPKKIFVSDMDSTIIAHETLDEVANYLGLGEKISKITTRTMMGELNFESSLCERVRLLAGKPHNAFDVIHQRLDINAGAHTTLRTLKKQGIKTALVSGGFDTTVNLVAQKLGFDYGYANTLAVHNGKITGYLMGDIVGAKTKQHILSALCAKYNTTPDFAIAIGDGANDIPMIRMAGMGIGYMGKPIVQAQADFQINLTDLTSVLYFMGIKQMDFC